MTYETEIILYHKDNWLTNFLIWLHIIDEEYTIPIEVEYDATPYVPAQTYGPPENCHPEEGGEIDIISITNQLNGEEVVLDKQQEDKLWNDIAEYESNRLRDRYEEEREDYER